MAYNPGSFNYMGGGSNSVSMVSPQTYAMNAQRQLNPAPPSLPSYSASSFATPSFGGGGPTLSSLLNMSPESLLQLRTKYRIAEDAPALAENARQFDIGNTGTNERYYAGLGENARQSDMDTAYRYDALGAQTLLDQLNAWSRMLSGLT